jgi:hypothetical protein
LTGAFLATGAFFAAFLAGVAFFAGAGFLAGAGLPLVGAAFFVDFVTGFFAGALAPDFAGFGATFPAFLAGAAFADDFFAAAAFAPAFFVPADDALFGAVAFFAVTWRAAAASGFERVDLAIMSFRMPVHRWCRRLIARDPAPEGAGL